MYADFDQDNSIGLSSYIEGKANYDDIVVKTDINNLDIIETVEDILSNGTEHDLQLKYLEKYSMRDLKLYLIE